MADERERRQGDRRHGRYVGENCLSHALDKWSGEGGYLLIVRASDHPWSLRHPRWVLSHVMHMDSAGYLTSYAPEKDLAHPARALFGFEGQVSSFDASPANPMPVRGLLASAWLLAFGSTAWAIRRQWRKWRGHA